jgi:nucleoside-diphosphate-sugar epimerase
MKKILITGATGFVGRQIMSAYRDLQVKLLPVVRMGKEDEVADIENVEDVISSPNIFLESEDWWEEKCKDVDIIIHSAWYAEPGEYLISAHNMDCLAGSLSLAKGAVKSGVKRIVGIGTCFEYDLASGVLSVDTALKPVTPYAAAKAALYLSLLEWLPMQSVEFAWCRLFYLYGAGEDDRRLVPYIRKQLEKGEFADLTSGNQIRDFMDVEEVGRKIADVALSEIVGPINICSGIPITVKQLAEQIATEYGRNDLLRFGFRAENLIDPWCVLGIPNH